MSIILGVDPGKSGAIAALRYNGALIGVDDMPVLGGIVNAQLLAEQMHNYVDPLIFPWDGICVIEDVHAMPKQGVSSTFDFGVSKGIAIGAAAADSWSLRFVTPARWKRDLGLSKDKGASRRMAIELWPARAQMFARVKDDGRAEAALIAYWFLTKGAK